MQKRPTVGIVVPSYNQGAFIEQTITSVIDNMAYADIKLVVIDGGSTDDTVAIIKRYSQYIFHWVSEADRGQANAINKGMQFLKDCNYVTWINSDDVYDSAHSVQKMVEFAVRHSLDVCYGKSYLIDQQGNRTKSYHTCPFQKSRLKYECFISQPSTLIDRVAWDSVGGVDESLFLCMDYALWVKLAQKYKFGYLEQYIANTRIHPDTKTAKYQANVNDEAIAILHKYYHWIPYHWVCSKVWQVKHPGRNDYNIRCIMKVFLFKPYYVNHAVKKIRSQGYI